MRLHIFEGGSDSSWTMPTVDELFSSMMTHPLSLLSDVGSTGSRRRWPEAAFDVEETDPAFLLSADLPGVRIEDLKLEVSDGALSITGERKHGRSLGRFERRVTLPTGLDTDAIEASLSDGVLRIALPKAKRSESRVLEVQRGPGGLLTKLLSPQKTTKGETETH